MYEAVKPRFAMPVHGGPVHLAAHADLALTLGVEAAITPVNGGVYELSHTGLSCLGRVPSRLVAVLGDGAGTIVPWNDVEKAAILTEDERKRLDDQVERERARGERMAKRGVGREGAGKAGANKAAAGRDGSVRPSDGDRGKRGGRSTAVREQAPVHGAQARPFETVVTRQSRATRRDEPVAKADAGHPSQDARPVAARKPASAKPAVAQPRGVAARKAPTKPGALDRTFIAMMSKLSFKKR